MTVNNRIPFGARTVYTVNPHLPPLILQELTNQVKELTYERSHIGVEGQETEHSMRTSNQCWLCWDTWEAGIMHNIFISANNDYYQYDLDHFDSGIQATRYEVGQTYGWHVDDGQGIIGKARKLSMSMVLDSEFTGGELEIYDAFQNKASFARDSVLSFSIDFSPWVTVDIHGLTWISRVNHGYPSLTTIIRG